MTTIDGRRTNGRKTQRRGAAEAARRALELAADLGAAVNPRQILEAIAGDPSVSASVRVRACQALLSHPASTAEEDREDKVTAEAIERLRGRRLN